MKIKILDLKVSRTHSILTLDVGKEIDDLSVSSRAYVVLIDTYDGMTQPNQLIFTTGDETQTEGIKSSKMNYYSQHGHSLVIVINICGSADKPDGS